MPIHWKKTKDSKPPYKKLVKLKYTEDAPKGVVGFLSHTDEQGDHYFKIIPGGKIHYMDGGSEAWSEILFK